MGLIIHEEKCYYADSPSSMNKLRWHNFVLNYLMSMTVWLENKYALVNLYSQRSLTDLDLDCSFKTLVKSEKVQEVSFVDLRL